MALRLRFVSRKALAARIVALALALSAGGYAQEFRATLAGHVTDASGGGIPDARIEIRNADTGQTSSTLSAPDGAYQASFLTPGGYVVTVEKPGFKRAVRTGVTLQIAQRAVVDVELALGDVTQSVSVMGET